MTIRTTLKTAWRRLRAFFVASPKVGMADLLALAIRRSHHPDGLSGYVGFTERYAVWNDVNKALAEEDDFRGATAKAWFAVGYLSGLLDPEGPADGFGAADETPAAEDLAVLLQWLRHVHDGASDSAVVDTPSVLEHFKGKAAASLVGRQFREPVDPGPGRSAWEVLPPLEIDAAEVARISLAARQFVTPAAYALGQAHGRLQPT